MATKACIGRKRSFEVDTTSGLHPAKIRFRKRFCSRFESQCFAIVGHDCQTTTADGNAVANGNFVRREALSIRCNRQAQPDWK
jgi:hypothetical protein